MFKAKKYSYLLILQFLYHHWLYKLLKGFRFYHIPYRIHWYINFVRLIKQFRRRCVCVIFFFYTFLTLYKRGTKFNGLCFLKKKKIIYKVFCSYGLNIWFIQTFAINLVRWWPIRFVCIFRGYTCAQYD